MKLTESQLKQIVKEEISKTLNEVNSASWFVKVGHDKMSVPKRKAENAVQALELAILDRLNHPEISDKMKKRIVDFVDDFYTVLDLSTGVEHENIQVSDSFLKTNKDLLDKYSPILKGRNNMKLTESQLRKIIREELEAVREADGGRKFQYGSIEGGFSDEFSSRLQKVLAIKAKKKEELGRNPTSDELQDAMRAAGMKDPDEEAPMEEAAGEEAKLVHRDFPFTVYRTGKGAGPTPSGDLEGFKSQTHSKVYSYILYRPDGRIGSYPTLGAAKAMIAQQRKTSSRKRPRR